MLARLEKGTSYTAARWQALAGVDHAVFAATDPLSFGTVMLAELDIGVDVTDLNRLDRMLHSAVADYGRIRSVELITIDRKRGLRYRFDVSRDGMVEHHIIDAFDIHGPLVDLAFVGGADTVAAITATIHFRSG